MGETHSMNVKMDIHFFGEHHRFGKDQAASKRVKLPKKERAAEHMPTQSAP